MRKLSIFLCSLMFPMVGYSQVLVTPNTGGGEIVLTSRPCVVNKANYDQFREAYSWSPKVRRIPACWTIQDGNVLVIYLDDGQERIYPMTSFRERK